MSTRPASGRQQIPERPSSERRLDYALERRSSARSSDRNSQGSSSSLRGTGRTASGNRTVYRGSDDSGGGSGSATSTEKRRLKEQKQKELEHDRQEKAKQEGKRRKESVDGHDKRAGHRRPRNTRSPATENNPGRPRAINEAEQLERLDSGSRGGGGGSGGGGESGVRRQRSGAAEASSSRISGSQPTLRPRNREVRAPREASTTENYKTRSTPTPVPGDHALGIWRRSSAPTSGSSTVANGAASTERTAVTPAPLPPLTTPAPNQQQQSQRPIGPYMMPQQSSLESLYAGEGVGSGLMMPASFAYVNTSQPYGPNLYGSMRPGGGMDSRNGSLMMGSGPEGSMLYGGDPGSQVGSMIGMGGPAGGTTGSMGPGGSALYGGAENQFGSMMLSRQGGSMVGPGGSMLYGGGQDSRSGSMIGMQRVGSMRPGGSMLYAGGTNNGSMMRADSFHRSANGSMVAPDGSMMFGNPGSFGPGGYYMGSTGSFSGGFDLFQIPGQNKSFTRQPSDLQRMMSLGSSMSGGSAYGIRRYNSMDLGSTYGSLYGLERMFSSRKSYDNTGGYVGPLGLFEPPKGFNMKAKPDYSIPPPSNALFAHALPSRPRTVKIAPDNSEAEAAEEKRLRQMRDAARLRREEEENAERMREEAADAERAAQAKKAAEERARLLKEAEEEQARLLAKTRALEVLETLPVRPLKSIGPELQCIAVLTDPSLAPSLPVGEIAAPKKRGYSASATNTVDIPGSSEKFEMDEVHISAEGLVEVADSDALCNASREVLNGHNVAFLALTASSSRHAAENIIIASLTRILDDLQEAEVKQPGRKSEVLLSASAFPDPDTARDVLLKPAALAKNAPCQVGKNPVYGSCVMGMSQHAMKSSADSMKSIVEAVARSDKKEMLVMVFTVKQIIPSPSSSKGGGATAPEVYVSSIFVALMSDANMAYLQSLRSRTNENTESLFSYVFTGRAVTTVIVPVTPTEPPTTRDAALQEAAHMRRITPTENVASGNMKRFIEFTEKSYAKRSTTEEPTASEAEVKQKMKQILDDAKQLNAHPEMTPLPVYPQEKEQGLMHSGKRREAGTKVAAVIVGAPRTAVQVRIDRKDPTDESAFVTLPGSKTRVPFDEVIETRTGDAMPNSPLFDTAGTSLRAGYNVAVLSAEMMSTTPLAVQFTWRNFTRTLERTITSAAGDESAGITHEIQLYMCVLRRREALCDLFAETGGGDGASTGAFPFTVVSSPLFGSIIYGTQHKVLRDPTKVDAVVKNALFRAALLLERDDDAVVAIVVYKRIEADDVVLSSMLCSSSHSTAMLRALSDNNEAYSRSLYSYAVKGPCMTTTYIVTEQQNGGDAEAFAVHIGDIKTLERWTGNALRDGSVKRFVEYGRKNVEHADAKLASAETANDSAKQRRYEHQVRRSRRMVEDHEELLRHPVKTPLPTYTSDGSRSSTLGKIKPPNPVLTVAVVVDSRDSGAAADNGSLTAQLESTEEYVRCKGTSYKPTEIVNVKANTIRSRVVDDVVYKLLGGFNAALLTADAKGSTVGRSLATKTVLSVLKRLASRGDEAYWSVIVQRGNKFKDILTSDSSDFTPMELGVSPTFGPIAEGAVISRLSSDGSEVEGLIKTACVERVTGEGGVVIIVLIPKLTEVIGGDAEMGADGGNKREEKGVTVPSLLLAIAGNGSGVYSEVVHQRAHERGLFQYALGGPCHTVYVGGVLAHDADAASPILNFIPELNAFMNPPLRSSSLKRFVEYTESMLSALQAKARESTGSERDEALRSAIRVEEMVNDAKAMIASPQNRPVTVYKR